MCRAMIYKLHGRGGFTLMELVVTIGIMGAVLSASLGMFMAFHSTWQRISESSNSKMALELGVRRMEADLREAVDCQIITRFGTNDAVIVVLPSSTAQGRYVPEINNGELRYSPGPMRAYYLSDTSGQWMANGDILWCGRVTSLSPITVVPDTAESLWPGTTQGQVQPVASLRVDAPGVGDPDWVYTITLTAPERVQMKTSSRSVKLRVLARNHQ